MGKITVSKAEIEKAVYGRTRHKYGHCAPEDRTADGIVFQSKHEMDVYKSFASLHRAGIFTSLRRQVPFPIFVNDPKGIQRQVFVWVADFVVTDLDGREHIYDAKAWDEKKQKFVTTAVYRLKRKAVEAQYGIRILEV